MIIEKAILTIYPNAIPLVNFNVQDDGQGQFIRDWSYSEPQPTEEELQTAWIGYVRGKKLEELNNACQSSILNGFTGTNGHQYQFDWKDQDNLTQQMVFLVNDPTIATVDWKTKDVGIVSHTRAEFLQVCADANNHKRVNMGKYWTLEAELNTVTTEAEINVIVW